MNDKNFAFGKVNYILMAASIAIVIVGFVLMSGSSSTEQSFDSSIFNAQRTKVAPVICLIGFVSMVFAIIYKPKSKGGGISSKEGSNDDVTTVENNR